MLEVFPGRPSRIPVFGLAALAANATTEEILGAMIALPPISGIARVVPATPDIAPSIGYDVDAALGNSTRIRPPPL